MDIQDYFDDILKKHKENINNLSIKIYADKIKNRTTFNIKNGYNLKLLTSETIKLLGSTKNKITKDKSGETYWNYRYQQNSRVLYTFLPNNLFGSLFETSPTNYIPLKTFSSEFQAIKVLFTDQNS